MRKRYALWAAVCSLGTLLLSNAVRADGGVDGGPTTNCDPTTLVCSNGQVPQKLESKEELPIGVDTGWAPVCTNNPTGHCVDHHLQLRSWLRFVPLDTAQPTYVVDMPGSDTVVDARWPSTDAFEMSLANGKPSSATFKVAHGLSPSFVLYLDTPVFTGEISIDASLILPLLGGGAFNYAAVNATKFTPWGFGPVTLAVAGADLQNSQLFAINLKDLGKIVVVNGTGDYLEGTFSFNAVTKSTFSYQTLRVSLLGAPGTIAAPTATIAMPGPWEDALESSAAAEGALRYSGQLEYLPVINITKIAGFPITLTFPISVGLKTDFDSGAIPVKFPEAPLHVPLPNLKVPKDPIAFGTVPIGSESDKKVVLSNSGELGVVFETQSSHPDFTVTPSSATIAPSGSLELSLTFTPTTSLQQNATITVKSNDPDSPSQTLVATGSSSGDLPDSGLQDSGQHPDSSDSSTPGKEAAADTSVQPEAAFVCVPGQTVSCACVGGTLGVQVCRNDGSGYGACQGCTDASAPPNSDASSAAPASPESDSSCSCETAGSTSSSSAGLLFAAVVGGLLSRRSRRCPRRDT